jgi:cell division protein FtsN
MARRRGLGSRTNRRKGGGAPGWLWLLLGLGIGGAGVWLWQDGALPWQPAPESITEAAPADEPTPETTPAEEPTPAPPAAEERRFEFYELLPDAEVVVPEDEGPPPPAGPPPVDVPGAYVIQAGAFPEFAEADAVKARLALLGVEAEIQKVTVDERTFHRVRVGPIENLNELNRLRTRLRQNRIDFLVIQVSE